MPEPTPGRLDVLEALLGTSKLAQDLYDQLEGSAPFDPDEDLIVRVAGLITRLEAIHKALLIAYVQSGRASADFRRRLARSLRQHRS